jgi:hypothetical protein
MRQADRLKDQSAAKRIADAIALFSLVIEIQNERVAKFTASDIEQIRQRRSGTSKLSIERPQTWRGEIRDEIGWWFDADHYIVGLCRELTVKAFLGVSVGRPYDDSIVTRVGWLDEGRCAATGRIRAKDPCGMEKAKVRDKSFEREQSFRNLKAAYFR